MRILVAEDEMSIREHLTQRLEERGYIVDAVDNGADAIYCGEEYAIDLAVIDLGLPKIDGIDVIKTLRQQGKVFPILILTARSRWQEKVEGLDAGADDYLTKPFHIEELIARVNALVRRVAGQSDNVLTNGSLSVDVSAQVVEYDGNEIDLTAYEYRLLHYLMLNLDKVVSKSELVEHIYAEDNDKDSNTIEVFVRRLRKKLDPDSIHKPIETLRGRGYRLVKVNR
ncbi:MAG: response regulator transcription factor [Arenicella sp.]